MARRSRDDGDFAKAFAAAIQHRQLSLEEIRDHLRGTGTPVSVATLSYWQRGRSLPAKQNSLQAIAELEKLLVLPVGHLTSRLPRDVFSRWDPVLALPVEEQQRAVLTSLGLLEHFDSILVSVHDAVTVDAPRRWQHETTREVFRASVDGQDRCVQIIKQRFHDEDPPPLVTAGAGCRLGRVVELDDEGLLCVEFLLPQPVARDGLAFLEYTFSWELPGGLPSGGFGRVLQTELESLVLEARFQCPPPTEAYYYTTPQAFEGIDPTNSLTQPLPADVEVQVALDPAPRGLHALEWTWQAA